MAYSQTPHDREHCRVPLFSRLTQSSYWAMSLLLLVCIVALSWPAAVWAAPAAPAPGTNPAADGGISGTVFNPGGAPAADANVVLVPGGQTACFREGRFEKFDPPVDPKTASSFRVWTDKAGRFAFQSDLRGFVVVVLHDSGVAHIPTAELAGSRRIDLIPWGRIEGSLLKGEQPAIRALVQQRAYLAGGPGQDVWIEGASNIRHDWAVKPVAPGRFLIDRVAPGVVTGFGGLAQLYCGPGGRMLFEVRPGETTSLTLQTRRTIAGQLITLPGSSFRLDPLRMRVTLSRMRRNPPVGSDAQSREHYNQEMRAFQELKKQVKDEPYAEPQESKSVELKPDANGSLTSEKLLPGEYALEVAVYDRPVSEGFKDNRMVAAANYLVYAPVVPEADADRPAGVGRLVVRPVQEGLSAARFPAAPPPTTGRIEWGEPVDGLRAGLEFTGGDRPYEAGQVVSVRLYVENVGKGPIRLAANINRDDPAEILDARGRPVFVWNESFHAAAEPLELELSPGTRALLGESALSTQMDPAAGGSKATVRSPNGFRAYGGTYRARYAACLPDLKRVSGGPRPGKSRGGPWHGVLKTGWSELTVHGPAAPLVQTWPAETISPANAQAHASKPTDTQTGGYAAGSGLRLMHFPIDGRLGDSLLFLFEDKPAGRTRKLAGKARGTVEVPLSAQVELFIDNPDWVDLAPLAGLRPDDLQSLVIHLNGLKDSDLANVGKLTGLRYLEIMRANPELVSGAGLAHLADLQGLEVFKLYAAAVTDGGLDFLGRCPKLRQLELQLWTTDAVFERLTAQERVQKALTALDLWDHGVSDAGLVHLNELKSLRTLHVRECRLVTDKILARLKELGSLEDLTLSGTRVTDAGMTDLTGLPHLKRLWLQGTPVTDAGVARLKDLKTVQWLALPSRMTDAGLPSIGGMKSLRILWLDGDRITDAGLARLEGLTGLEYLSLPPGVTDAGLVHLEKLPHLRRLELGKTKVTDAGLAQLARLPTLGEVGLPPAATDKGLEHLKDLRSLTAVWWSDAHITESGVKALRRARPGVYVAPPTSQPATQTVRQEK